MAKKDKTAAENMSKIGTQDADVVDAKGKATYVLITGTSNFGGSFFGSI